MTEPASWELALYEAEKTCHLRLAKILGLTDGVDAFIGSNGGKVDCAVFDIGYAMTGEVFGFAADKYHFRGRVDLYSRDRKQIQIWIMRILKAMPIARQQSVTDDLTRESNVYCFRTAPETKTVEEITTVELKKDKQENGVPVWTTAVQFDIVFSAGKRAPAQA